MAKGFNDKYVLKMRTVEAAMYTVAKEESRYRKSYKNWHDDPKSFGSSTNLDLDFVSTNYVVATTNLYHVAKNTNLYAMTAYYVVTNRDSYDKSNIPNNDNSCLVGTSKIYYGQDGDGPYAIVLRINDYPLKVRPLMRLTCPYPENNPSRVQRGGVASPKLEIYPSHLLAEISYGDGLANTQKYFVGDNGDGTQNRAVFTMLSYLFAQTAISTQNLPVQQLIQVQ